MADDDAQRCDEPGELSEPRAEFDMEFVDWLPGGRAVIPVESQGRFTWLVVRGHVSEQARQEFVRELQHIVGRGLWRQDWPAGAP
ncbi:hypothetical protein STRAU_3880 [Streptomyces aurantiacus JA 4570]|uniref:Uncharacterized protein n=1 Tax=Streptomyces aurantiacus JA 4570 TaxID=1286094 RepID=S4ANN6_9ACTN|nr:hypothetical protein [Streptomyces aurantiacus]EPH43052.1 hypothetical protein STRAU_3880 [Streptomyces aurantiacus JA 4570]